MTAGRKPKPVEVKRLAGNPGRRPLPTDNPKARIGLPSMPRGLFDERTQRLWHSLGEALERNGVITELDGAAFMFLCMHFEMGIRAWLRMKKDGEYQTVGDDARLVAHPAVKVVNEASKNFRQYAALFGVTPSDRGRLHLEPELERSLAEILFEGAGETDNG